MIDLTNADLSKLDPMKFPRDPLPPRMTIRVYRLGNVKPFFTLYGIPGHQSWHSKATAIADYFQCDRDDVSTRELDDGIEAIMVNGEIVGSFDLPIVPALGE